MRRQLLVLTTSALIVVCGAMAAIAQRPMTPRADQQAQQAEGSTGQGGMIGCGMMGQGGAMGRGTMGGMGGRMMGRGMMMRMMFSLMDADGDGTLSLQEFQAAHERIFKAMDSNKDGRLTPEEMQAFMQGTRRSVQP
jgi:hypothetical protein